MYLYKYRAESYVDVSRYYSKYPCEYIVVTPIHRFPDCEVVMGSNLQLDEIKKQMEEIPDSHVMMETIKAYDEYTGERTYE